MEKKWTNNTCISKCLIIVFAIILFLGMIRTCCLSNKTWGLTTLSSAIPVPQEPNQNSNTKPKETPLTQPNADPSVNILTQAAVRLGILSCISRINQVATFLTANNKSGIFIFNPKNKPDQHIFSTSFELIRNDESSIYASASFFPNQDAVYDTVEYVNKSCEEIEKGVFANLKRVAVIKKNVIVLDGGAVKVFLMPAGSGTVVIKKEVMQ
jgi:hypothetical protein